MKITKPPVPDDPPPTPPILVGRCTNCHCEVECGPEEVKGPKGRPEDWYWHVTCPTARCKKTDHPIILRPPTAAE